MDGLDVGQVLDRNPLLDSPAHLNAGVYHYGADDRVFLRDRIAQFARQVERRLDGRLTEDEFKPLRLMNGLYLQLHAYMLRVAIPYGVLSSVQLRQLAMIAERYDRGYGHFTTRQNIQYNWTELARTPEMLGALADVDMHAMQTSGNCIRNVTTDEYAGAAADEIVDPRVYAEILRQWSTLHPEFSFLPRKFKIAITGATSDRAAVQVHDIGLIARRDSSGAVGFRVYVGGGLGRVPMLGFAIRDFVAEADLLGYLEAILRVYNALGGRENIHKARIKILVRDLGRDRFTAAVDAEYAAVPRETYRLDPSIVAGIRAHFAAPDLLPEPDAEMTLARDVAGDVAFSHWVSRNVRDHRVAGYASAVISLKPIGGIPGDATAEQMRAVAALAERHSLSEIRVSHEQNLVLPHVRRDQLHTLWQALGPLGLATANSGLVSDIIACPGLDYCALANARAIPIAQLISERYADLDRQRDLGTVHINISGCINACGHHHVGHIGILGVDKQGQEFYQITIGGAADDAAALGQLVGPAVSADAVVDTVEAVLDHYVSLRSAGEAFVDVVRRVGIAPFREKLRDAA